MTASADPLTRLGPVLEAFGIEARSARAPRSPMALVPVSPVAVTAEPITSGHIHRTWLVTAGPERYVAQQVNTAIFTDLEACEENLDRIDRHFGWERAATVRVPTFRRTAAGAVHAVDSSGAPWRLTEFAAGTIAGATVADAAQAHEAAAAFGCYVAALVELPGGPLRETIVGFHDLGRRVGQLRAALASDPCDRLRGCGVEVARVLDTATAVDRRLATIAAVGIQPVRAVHNDAKVANLRFDDGGRARIVLDLDTTMPGLVIYDIGELLRTATRPLGDDDAEPAPVERPRVEAVVRGFLDAVGGDLTAAERAAATVAGPLMAAENAVRFITDHLLGDTYFAIARPGQNLDRARTQLDTAAQLLAAADWIAAISR